MSIDAADQPVDRPAEEAGDDLRRCVPNTIVISIADDADLERAAAAVEQAHGDVAAVRVGAEEVMVDVPGRSDRDALQRW